MLPQAVFLFGLAPDGVYLAAYSHPQRGALLPHHFTLTMQAWRYISVALSVRFPCLAVSQHPHSLESGLSSARLKNATATAQPLQAVV